MGHNGPEETTLTAQGLEQPKHMVNVSRWNEGGGGGRFFLGNKCLDKSGFKRIDGEDLLKLDLKILTGEAVKTEVSRMFEQ